MSAFFFPQPARKPEQHGFVAFSSGERVFYARQEVQPLELAPLLKDSGAKRSLIASAETHEGVPEKFFTRYYREDGTDFFVGTVEPSEFTYPYPRGYNDPVL